MKHKHYDCIVAWAEGKEIEFRSKLTGEWTKINFPLWDKDTEYRIKPNTIKFRNYLYSKFGDKYHIGICRSTDMRPADMSTTFIKWIGDWQEVEVDS